MYGMSMDQLGKQFIHNDDKCKFIGFKPGARSNIAIFENLVTCSRYVTSAEQIYHT